MTTMDIAVPDTQRRAERKLAALLLIHADLDIDPDGLGVFIRENWSKISPLAHIIHGREDNTKGGAAGAGKSDPQPYDNGWIEWKGGTCPVPPGAHYEVQFRNGGIADGHSMRDWAHNLSGWDIVAYRVIP